MEPNIYNLIVMKKTISRKEYRLNNNLITDELQLTVIETLEKQNNYEQYLK